MITFSTPQTISYPSQPDVENVETATIRTWDQYETEDGGTACHVYLDDSRAPLKNLLRYRQSEIAAILSNGDTELEQREAIVKEAIESGDYNG